MFFLQFLTALRFFAKGGYCSEFGRIHGISKTAAAIRVAKISRFLVGKARDVIQLPSER
jgi:hypothetical protein